MPICPKVRGEIAVCKAAAEFDDADALSGAVELGEVVTLREGGGGYQVRCGEGARTVGGFDVGARVQAEDSGDDAAEFARDGDAAAASAIASGRMLEHAEFGGKRTESVAQLAGERERPLGGAAMGDGQVVALREVLDGVQVFAARAVAVGEFGASEISALGERSGVEFFYGCC